MDQVTRRSESTALQRQGLERLETCAREGHTIRAFAKRRRLPEQRLWTTKSRKGRPWRHDLNKRVSGIPGAAQAAAREGNSAGHECRTPHASMRGPDSCTVLRIG